MCLFVCMFYVYAYAYTCMCYAYVCVLTDDYELKKLYWKQRKDTVSRELKKLSWTQSDLTAHSVHSDLIHPNTLCSVYSPNSISKTPWLSLICSKQFVTADCGKVPALITEETHQQCKLQGWKICANTQRLAFTMWNKSCTSGFNHPDGLKTHTNK